MTATTFDAIDDKAREAYAEFGAMWEWAPARLQRLELGVENGELLLP